MASEPRTTRVVLDRGLNPFEQLSPIERRRLMVRVLCGLVAYDDVDDAADLTPEHAERLAG